MFISTFHLVLLRLFHASSHHFWTCTAGRGIKYIPQKLQVQQLHLSSDHSHSARFRHPLLSSPPFPLASEYTHSVNTTDPRRSTLYSRFLAPSDGKVAKARVKWREIVPRLRERGGLDKLSWGWWRRLAARGSRCILLFGDLSRRISVCLFPSYFVSRHSPFPSFFLTGWRNGSGMETTLRRRRLMLSLQSGCLRYFNRGMGVILTISQQHIDTLHLSGWVRQERIE